MLVLHLYGECRDLSVDTELSRLAFGIVIRKKTPNYIKEIGNDKIKIPLTKPWIQKWYRFTSNRLWKLKLDQNIEAQTLKKLTFKI